MMVTFVSQCEKKALNRTRRVLDAFADRIGDNTWQAIITQEGLLAVKKLLRKTASKSTAVSCHWLRSRSRSELVWVVGSKKNFNGNGVVPVNTTQKEVPMDIARDIPIKGVEYANTHLQRLDQHLFAVGYIAEALYLKFYPSEGNIARAAFVSGCFHDIGKVDPNFQTWVTKEKNKAFVAEDGQHIDEAKFSFEKHPRHNEISLFIYALLDDLSLKSLNGTTKRRVKHAIYWHHAKPFRPNGGFETLGEIFKPLDKSLNGKGWELIVEKSIQLMDKVAKIDADYRDYSESCLKKCMARSAEPDKIWDIEAVKTPAYKEYDEADDDISKFCGDAKSNAINNQLRACLITADRWISGCSSTELDDLVRSRQLDAFMHELIEKYGMAPESALDTHITECLASFPNDSRGQKQAEVAQTLVAYPEKVAVLAGAAGCGKTKIGLEWAKLSGAKKLFWICPRVQICQGLFAELSCSDRPYLPEATVELHTGEFKCINTYNNITAENDYFSGDIVITTIDQLLNTVISHSNADRLLNYLSVHVVFDEYHEYINMPAFNLLFAELIAARNGLAGGSKALLVSATPNYLYLNKMLGLEKGYDIVEMPSFNPCKYQFEFIQYDEAVFDETNPLYKPQNAVTFVISNTAGTAQKSFVINQAAENSVLLHSKFKKSDKRSLFDVVFNAFKRDGTRLYDLLRSGPIVQASLNISCEKMVSEICSAENTLQRLGRLDRFGQNKTGINVYQVVVPDTLHNGKRTGSVARFMSSTNILSSSLAWYTFLREATDDGSRALTLPQIYCLYSEFYDEPTSVRSLEEDLLASLKKSAMLISNKAAEPKVIIKPKAGAKQRAKISKSSLRGDSRFVQMAICDLSNAGSPVIKDEYAYEIPSSEQSAVDNLTESLESIRNTGLLDYLAQKHGRIDEASVIKGIPANKMSARKAILESYARDPEYPLFLSYTPSELDQKLGERTAHEYAIYYGVCSKQAIGSISLKQLSNLKD